MHQFRRYPEGLQQLAQTYLSYAVAPAQPRLDRALNGEAADRLFASVPVEVLRRSGAFFTPAPLATQLADRVATQLASGRGVLDPACGAGDLLLACARKLPVTPDLASTLDAWGKQLHGCDIHPEF